MNSPELTIAQYEHWKRTGIWPGADSDDNWHQFTPRQRVLSWVCRIIAAGIMTETLWFKFTGHPESVWIFSQMHMEPFWRIGQGIVELLAAFCLLTPRNVWIGVILTNFAMASAVLSHLGVIGIEVQGDHGLLFGMACTTLLASLIATWLHQKEIPLLTRLDTSELT